MQDLLSELNHNRWVLKEAISQLKLRGQKKAEAEKDYRIALAKEILLQREAGMPVTIIGDICRGKEEIALLKMERDISETLYDTAMQAIYQSKLEISIIENQMKAERKGE